jgi:hypothetical protein
LLIRDNKKPPLSVATFREKLEELLTDCEEFMVDSCEPPVKGFHLDFPIMGAGHGENPPCYLLVFAYITKKQ